VKINSTTNSQPATNGSTRKKTNGLMIKKEMMASLYQSGALPRKFLIKAFPRDIGMLILFYVDYE
jgi:hypothetical protein